MVLCLPCRLRLLFVLHTWNEDYFLKQWRHFFLSSSQIVVLPLHMLWITPIWSSEQTLWKQGAGNCHQRWRKWSVDRFSCLFPLLFCNEDEERSNSGERSTSERAKKGHKTTGHSNRRDKREKSDPRRHSCDGDSRSLKTKRDRRKVEVEDERHQHGRKTSHRKEKTNSHRHRHGYKSKDSWIETVKDMSHDLYIACSEVFCCLDLLHWLTSKMIFIKASRTSR